MNNSDQIQKPPTFIAIVVMTLISGIINLFWGFVASATMLGTIIGIVCLPITILPTILGVFEIIYAAKLLSAQPQPVQPSPTIAIFQTTMILYGNIFSAVVGILNLIFFNDLTVKEYFAHLNGIPTMPPVPVPITPALDESKNESMNEPKIEEPEKPKRIRKVAGK